MLNHRWLLGMIFFLPFDSFRSCALVSHTGLKNQILNRHQCCMVPNDFFQVNQCGLVMVVSETHIPLEAFHGLAFLKILFKVEFYDAPIQQLVFSICFELVSNQDK